jgi:hypothetical protein
MLLYHKALRGGTPISNSDSTPNQFTFTDQTDVSLSSTITSAAVTITGIDTAATITVSGGTYDINSSGSFTSSSGSVNNNDTVRARHTSSASNSTATNTVVTIGGVQDTFTSTTEAASGLLYPDFPYDHTRSIESGSLYVDPVSGSNSNNGLSQGAAKATIAGAISALGTSSSKKIYLMNGTHTVSSTVTCSGSGSSGTPIELTSLPGHEPVVNITALNGFAVDNVSYWRFSHLFWTGWEYGFIIAENNNTPNITFFCNEGETDRDDSTGNNSGFIHIWAQQRAPDITIDRIKLTFTGDRDSAALNTSGIYWKRTTNVAGLLDHFEIYNFPVGIYHKHGETTPSVQGDVIGRNGIIADCNRVPAGFNPSGWQFTNCIFHGSEVRLSEADGGPAGDLNRYDHCTFVTGLDLDSQDGGADNNTLYNCIVAQLNVRSGSSVTSTSDYNMFGNASDAIILNGSNQTLAAWRTANSSDANSVKGSYSFVGGSARDAASWQLVSSSLGENSASDGTDIGADVTAIGVQAA